MLTAVENERLTRVGPGTPMGELMRRYWHPIAAASELDENPTKAVRLLGEDLVLYRDRSGTLGLIGDRCAHRKVNMLYGIPEPHGLRCPYHGWLFDERGACLQQPYEEAEDPASTFKDKVRMKAYRVEELGGAIFAYLGPEPAPLLPRWDLFVWEDCYRDIGACIIPCNWLQIMENSLDPVHAEWLHNYWSNYVLERLGHGEMRTTNWINGRLVAQPWQHKKIGFDVWEHGIIKRRVMYGEDEESENWKTGHPVLFPQILRVGGWWHNFQYRVPVDDTHTYHFWYTVYPAPDGVTAPKQDVIPYYDVTVPGPDARGLPDWASLDNAPGQDMVAWVTQGPIADRSDEKLGLSDRGIILYRWLLQDNLAKVARGEDPMNTFRDPAKNQYIRMMQENRGGVQTGIRAVGNSGNAMVSWKLRNGTLEDLYPHWIDTKPRTVKVGS